MASLSKNLLVCTLHNKNRTTHSITTKHGSFIAPVMGITLLDFGEVLLETDILTNFILKFGMCFFSCDQAALQMVFSVCLSVRLSVRLSVTPF